MPDDYQLVRNWLTPGVTNRAAIQGALDYMFNNWGGGKVYLPPITLAIDGPINIQGATRLIGAGMQSVISAQDNADIPLCTLTGYKPAVKEVFFQGCTSRTASQNVVSVSENCPVLIKECEIRGGASALFNKGTDGTIEDCFIYGANFSCLTTNGANWYKRVKFDGSGKPALDPQYSIYIGTPIAEAPVIENSFEQCDMSGAWTSGYALAIFDGSGLAADTKFFGGIFSGGLSAMQAVRTDFYGSKFGSQYYSYGPQSGSVSMIGCRYVGPGTIATANALKVGCIGNFA